MFSEVGFLSRYYQAGDNCPGRFMGSGLGESDTSPPASSWGFLCLGKYGRIDYGKKDFQVFKE
jgi:hypothetical protein